MPPEPSKEDQSTLGELASTRDDLKYPWPPGPTLRPPDFGKGREHNRSVMQMEVLVPAYALSDMAPLAISSRVDTSAFRGIDLAPSTSTAAAANGAGVAQRPGGLEPMLRRRLSVQDSSESLRSLSPALDDGAGLTGAGVASGAEVGAEVGAAAAAARRAPGSATRRPARSPVRRSLR